VGGSSVRRASCAAVLLALLALAGCKDNGPAAPAAGPAGGGVAAATAGSAGPAAGGAGDQLTGEALARARTCLACHQVERKQVGPAYRDVAARFADDPNAVPTLAKAIRHGGRGQWGAVPMPAQPQVSEAEAAELARWVLTLKP
jgi:cytochrome c